MRLIKPLRKLFRMSDVNTHQQPQFTDNAAFEAHSLGDKEASADFVYQVPYVHQEHVNLCADSCVAMLKMFHGADVDMEQFRTTKNGALALIDNPRGPFKGMKTSDIKAQGLFAFVPLPKDRKWEPRKLAYHLQANGPIICSFQRHAVLLIGIQGSYIVFHDPWRGPDLMMNLDEFNKKLHWKDKTGAMLQLLPRTPGTKKY